MAHHLLTMVVSTPEHGINPSAYKAWSKNKTSLLPQKPLYSAALLAMGFDIYGQEGKRQPV